MRLRILKAFQLGTMVLVAVVLGFGGWNSASADVFNTGVDDNGVPLADGSVDPHYILIASDDPAFPGPDAEVVNAPIPFGWVQTVVGQAENSKWIAPDADQSPLTGGNELGSYIYRQTFVIPEGTNTEESELSGFWATDTYGLIFLNGIYTGFTNLAGPSVWTPFLINSGFQLGENTLDFVVINSGQSANATGLRVEISGTGIPEPSSIVLAGFGLLGLVVAGWRKFDRA